MTLTPYAPMWLPIVVSAVLVFVASSLIHMALKYHNSEYRGLANEDEVRAAIRARSPAPGTYVIPYCADMKAMGSEAMQAKFREGPVGFLTLRPNGAPSIRNPLIGWFLYSLGIAAVAAYLACHLLVPGAPFGAVCRLTGTFAFAAYAGGSIQAGIWWGKSWSAVLKEVFDGLVYGVLTGIAFAWLWPH